MFLPNSSKPIATILPSLIFSVINYWVLMVLCPLFSTLWNTISFPIVYFLHFAFQSRLSNSLINTSSPLGILLKLVYFLIFIQLVYPIPRSWILWLSPHFLLVAFPTLLLTIISLLPSFVFHLIIFPYNHSFLPTSFKLLLLWLFCFLPASQSCDVNFSYFSQYSSLLHQYHFPISPYHLSWFSPFITFFL